MDTIRNYLDNLFMNLPQTHEVLQAKKDLGGSMEDKYHEYKAAGRSENEAIGLVISEFGNIDELLRELSIASQDEPKTHLVDEKEARRWLDAKRRSGLLVAIGVMLCILAAASLILVSHLVQQNLLFIHMSRDAGNALGLVPLLLLVAAAVALFILSGVHLQKFQHLEKGFFVSESVQRWLENRKDQFSMTYTVSLIVGVALCILAPLAVILPPLFAAEGSGSLGVVFFLVLISFAVFNFVYYGSIKGSYDRLLKTGDFAADEDTSDESSKTLHVISAIIWPLAVIFFLLLGFLGNLWHIAWIVFPITGILQGMLSAVYAALKKDK